MANCPADDEPREWSNRAQYMLYTIGFGHGAALRAMREGCSGIEPYLRGYADGRRARTEAISAYAKELGYEPTILRLRDAK